MNDNQNLLLAVGLSLAILLGWQYLVAGPEMEAIEREQLAQQIVEGEQSGQAGATAPLASNSLTPQAPTNSSATPLVGAQNDAQSVIAPGSSRQSVIAIGERIEFDNALMHGTIRLKGGRIDDLEVKDYHETVDPTSPRVKILNPAGSEGAWFADFGWASSDTSIVLPSPETQWTLEKGKLLTPTAPVVLSWNNGAGLTFTRTISIDDQYMFSIEDGVTNSGDTTATLYPYGLIARHGTPEIENFFILHEGLIGVLGEDGLQELDYDELHDANVVQHKNTTGWLGITDKYWAATIIPGDVGGFDATFRAFNNSARTDWNYQTEYLSKPVTIAAGQSAQTSSQLFAGAKKSAIIDQYTEGQNIDRFDLLIDWGWLYFFTKPLFMLLSWFHGIFGNFGIAILLATVLIKAAFFPLANKSYKSMAKMKMLQPEMEKIRERHKDDRMKQQQAMMDLYRTKKLNPAAGCWPMLVQIPVFFALYKVLFVTIEMRHAPFFGWIQDLAAPDPTSIFNLFGLINFQPPEFLMIGVWPLLMGMTMFVQMRLNPPPPDKTQQLIFDLMPIFFTFLLATFPAGLVIYWTWNNLLSIIQQWIIMSRQGVKVDLLNNIKGSFGFLKGDKKENDESAS